MTLFTLIFRFTFKCSYTVKRLVRRLLSELISPQICLLCGEVSDNEVLCHKCVSFALPPVFALSDCAGEFRCKKCGKMLISEIELCTTCREKSVIEAVDSVFPMYPYRFWGKDILFLWKMANHRELSSLLAERIFVVWKERFSGLPIVPIPPRPGKIHKKGWDQIEELSKVLEYIFNVPIMRILNRTEKRQQKKLVLEERLNQNQSFILKKQSKTIFQKYNSPQNIVLLDDVMTTGATLQRCSLAVKQIGIKTVNALTLYIVE